MEFRLVFQLRDNIVSHQGDQEYKVDAVDAKYLLPKAQVKLMRDLPFEGLLPPMGIAAFSIHTPKNSSPSNGSSSSKGTSGGHVVQPPKDGWLLSGKIEEDVCKIKHLKSVVVTRLPNNATSCSEWRAAFLAPFLGLICQRRTSL